MQPDVCTDMRFTPLFVLLVAPSIAIAEPVLHAPRSARVNDFVAEAPNSSGIQFVRKLIAPNGHTNALAQSRTIYLNHTGVTLNPGNDDSTARTSSIVNSRSTVPAWNTSAATWAATVACFKDMWSRFDVTITDQDPGNAPHMMAVFGGSPQDVGMGQGVGGVSPFTDDCAVIENSIVFTFTDVFPDDAQTICEVMSQEVAHSYGLDHEMLASDPMTYLNYNGNRTFHDQAVACGEYSNRPCGIGGSTCRSNQNSVALLQARAGIADTIAPTLAISSPANGATVAPAFAVDATATDNVGVTMATLKIDGAVAGTIAGAGPYHFTTDAALAVGAHAIVVEVTDGKNLQSQTVTVTLADGTDPNGGGNGGGNGSNSGGSGDPTGGGGTGGGGTTGGGGCNAGAGGLGLGLAVALVGLRRRRRR